MPLQPTNLLLLLTMTTYNVAANDLEGVIVRFAPHPNPSFSFLHHTLNAVYGIDLYETDFYFLFHDVTANGQTELYKDAPKRLLDYMIAHIKTESAASTRAETEKVEKSFEIMLLSYKTKDKKEHLFQARSRTSQGNGPFYQEPTWGCTSKVYGFFFVNCKNLSVSYRHCGWIEYGQVIY